MASERQSAEDEKAAARKQLEKEKRNSPVKLERAIPRERERR